MRRSITIGVSLLGILNFLYLWQLSSDANRTPSLTRQCIAVLHSSYGGLHSGSFLVAGIVVCCFLMLVNLFSTETRLASSIAVCAVSAVASIGSLLLVWNQLHVLKNDCPWTLTVASAIVLLFALSILGIVGRHRAAQKSDSKALRGTLTLLAVGILAITAMAVKASSSLSARTLALQRGTTIDLPLIRPWSHYRGSVDAPIQIVVFGDFECQICGEQEPIIDSLLKEYGNRINYVFRHFPLDEIHPDAAGAAEASECIGSQGKFWPAYDKFYTQQADLTPEALVVYARELNIDVSAFEGCMVHHSTRQRIEDDIADADALGVDGTPTFFINGHRFVGMRSYEDLVKVIDHLLETSDSGR